MRNAGEAAARNAARKPLITACWITLHPFDQLAGVGSPARTRHRCQPVGPGGKPGAHGSGSKIVHVMKLLRELSRNVGVAVKLSACSEKKHNRGSSPASLQPGCSWPVEFIPSTTSKKRSRIMLCPTAPTTFGVSKKNPASAMHLVLADGSKLATWSQFATVAVPPAEPPLSTTWDAAPSPYLAFASAMTASSIARPR